MSAPLFDAAFRERLAELFRWRRDVRHFRRDPIADATLVELVHEAACSPSVGFSQPWRFVLVRDDTRRRAAIASFERANADALRGMSGADAEKYATLKLSGMREAPVHLAVFCDIETPSGKGLGRATMPETLAYSAVMAIYTFWLAARAQGIGVGWVSIIEPDVITAALDVPSQWKLIAYLCVGYPEDDHPTPELERTGWESRDPRATTLHNR
ncbi:MAG: 5,6-dimethylbenzimidazole synthase [bacterium]|nr:5,6-dimethylbenzimidazole synthase [bacterium]